MPTWRAQFFALLGGTSELAGGLLLMLGLLTPLAAATVMVNRGRRRGAWSAPPWGPGGFGAADNVLRSDPR
ncbi:DoxX family membrane protein [Amycolatopsis echigonensis]|uniref:DoxX family membrane protein n=1 Tax=Amycolatopsis echigonensis TaxID=2576905 RepID=A0A8E2B5U9_9PSEU|nr:DoxX family membrane protein [Amycolatopsis echigonensis]MBB2502351.1 DoxX family membrane protein [Amycolatopsis echigonensis]